MLNEDLGPIIDLYADLKTIGNQLLGTKKGTIFN